MNLDFGRQFGDYRDCSAIIKTTPFSLVLVYGLGFDLVGDRIRLEGGVKIKLVICIIMLEIRGSIATRNSSC